MLLCRRNFHLFGVSFCFGVAGKVSDLSRGAGLLLFGRCCGIGGCGSSLFWLLGFWLGSENSVGGYVVFVI